MIGGVGPEREKNSASTTIAGYSCTGLRRNMAKEGGGNGTNRLTTWTRRGGSDGLAEFGSCDFKEVKKQT